MTIAVTSGRQNRLHKDKGRTKLTTVYTKSKLQANFVNHSKISKNITRETRDTMFEEQESVWKDIQNKT